MGKLEDFVSGTYYRVATAENAKFYCKDEAEAKKFEGTHWKMTIESLGDGRWFCAFNCKEQPTWDQSKVYSQGVWEDYENESMGDKGRMIFKPNDTEDGFETDMESQVMGKTHFSEKYTPEGCTAVVTKNGESTTETWDRCHIEGTYKYTSEENMKAFLAEDGVDGMIEVWEKHYKLRWMRAGDNWMAYEWWGEKTPVVHDMKLNEEVDFHMPGMPTGKVSVTRRGPSQLTVTITLQPDGRKQEWQMDFSKDGCMQNGTNFKTGTKCKIWCERIKDPVGKWKPVAFPGVKQGCLKLGMDEKMANEFANEFDMRIEVDPPEGEEHHWNFHSKLAPMDMKFKFGEEFTQFDKALNSDVKLVVTYDDKDTYTVISKYPKMTFKSKTVVADNYMIYDTDCEETPEAKMCYILERDH